MRIFKVVFIENILTVKEYCRLKLAGVIDSRTDYGNAEISTNNVRHLEDEIATNACLTEEECVDSCEILLNDKDKDTVINLLSQEVYDALLNEDVDIAILCGEEK